LPCDGVVGARCNPSGAARRPNLVLVTCILASSLSFVDGSVLNVALPAIGRSLGAGSAELQWVVNAYLLPLSALLLLGGATGDLYGRRLMLIGGTALFIAASLLCALGPSLAWLLAGRALQGLGAAFLLPSSLAILSDTFEGEKRGQAVGIWAAAGAMAAAGAPLLGGWLVDGIGWQAIFYINIPIGAAAIGLAWLSVPESANPERPPPDWAGALLATFGLGGLTWALTAWSVSRALPASTIASLAAGVLMIFLFVLAERRRGNEAMVPLAMFGSRAFVGLTLLTLLLYGAFGAVMVMLPFVLIEAGRYTAVGAGAAMLPLPILLALGSPLMGRLTARIGPRWPLSLGPMIVAAGFLIGLRIQGEGSYWAEVFPCVVLLAIGMAIAVAPLTTAVLGSVEESHTGTASGLNSAVARTGGLIATALLGLVLARRGEALVAAFHGSLIASAATAIAAGLCAFLLLGTAGKEKGRP
jgi:EmrB/QacA subfamily drug resistance transporter